MMEEVTVDQSIFLASVRALGEARRMRGRSGFMKASRQTMGRIDGVSAPPFLGG